MPFEVLEKVLSVILSLMILGNFFLARVFVGTYLNPASLFSLFWFLYSFVPLVFLFDVPINSLSILYILTCCFSFLLGMVFFDWKKALYLNRQKEDIFPGYLYSKENRYIFYCLFFVVMALAVVDIKMQGFDISDFFFNYYESANRFMRLRYEHDVIVNFFGQASVVLNYALVMLGGVLAYCCKSGGKTIAILALLPSLIMTASQGAKGTILLSVFLFYGAILLARVFANDLVITNKRTNRYLILFTIFLVVVMCISFVSRGLYEYSSIEALMQKLIYYFNSYAFAHIYAFSDWFSYYVGAPHIMNYTDKHEIYFGFYTFMPIFEILGSSITVPDGVYDEYFYFSDVFTTNIYTVFRGVILDFRLIGSIVFWFILGLVAHLSYYFLLTKKMPIFSAPFFVVLFGFYYTSFIISLFIWASIGASLALLSLILFVNKYKFLSGRQK